MAFSVLSIVSSAIMTQTATLSATLPGSATFTFPTSLTSYTIGSNTFTYSGGSGSTLYKNGDYTISAQCWDSLYPPYRLFDNNTTTYWTCGTNGGTNYQLDGSTISAYNRSPYFPNATPASYRGGNDNNLATWSTTYNTSLNVTGEYWQVQFPFQFMLTKVYMIGESGTNVGRSPKSLYILGSTNGSTWTLVQIVTNSLMTQGTPTEYSYTVTNTNKYQYYRFVANTLISTPTFSGSCSLISLKMDGTAYY